MYTFLPKLLNMSVTGSVCIAGVLAIRLLLNKIQAPKIYSYVLWCTVLFRLLCPVSFSSVFSALALFDVPVTQEGAMEYIPENIVHETYPQVKLPVPFVSEAINRALPKGYHQTTFDPLEAPAAILTILWVLGATTIVLFGAFSFLRFRKCLTGAVRVCKNIYQSDYLESPCVVGMLRPRIYIPSSLNEKELEYILTHERYHIRRGDHLVKLAAFLASAMHWFNPLVWLMQVYLERDMEMSCDEAVMKRMQADVRADYANALLNYSSGKRNGILSPLAFGEHDAKIRIRNIMKWERPQKSKRIMTSLLIGFLALLLLANPADRKSIYGVNYQVSNIYYEAPQYNFSYGYVPEGTPWYTITSDGTLMEKQHGETTWVNIGGLKKVDYSRKERYQLFDPMNNSAHEQLDQVRNTWRVDVGDEQDTFYLIMQKRNGWVLLAHGYGEGLEGRVRWLFQLKAGSGSYDLMELEAQIESMINNEVEYFAISEVDSMPQCLVMGFQKGDDMGVAFFAYDAQKREYKIRSCSEFGGESLYSTTMAERQDLDHSITVALSRRDDLALVTADVGDMHQEIGVTNICPVMVVFEWPDILPEGEAGHVDVRFYNAAGEELKR